MISSLDDKQWKAERDILQDEWCSGTMSYDRAVEVEELMHTFDVIKGERDWAGKTYGGPVHSEHGWYLPSDD